MNDRDIELRLGEFLGAAPVVGAPDRLRDAVLRDRTRPAARRAFTWHRPTGRALSALVGLAATLVLAAALLTVVAKRPAPAASTKPPIGAFSQTGSLLQARYDQAAVTLSDGRVLIVGGDGPDGALASAELYDPTTGKFSATGSMTHARSFPAAALLSDGRVLVIGDGHFSIGGTGDNSAEVYDPATGRFAATGSMANARSDATTTLLQDGRVLVAGGDSGDATTSKALASAELYDPKTGTFGPTGSMAVARALHHAVLLKDGRVLVEGGWSASGDTAAAELYDPATGTFSPAGSMPEARIYDTATLLPNGRVLIAGGTGAGGVDPSVPATAELYDPATGAFSETGSMAFGRHDQTATLLRDGRVLIVGGFESDPLYTYRPVAEVYDPATGKFTSTPPLDVPTANHIAALLPDGRVLVAGGRGPTSGPIATAELYDPAATPAATPSPAAGLTPHLSP
jgi:hypothetical protein